MLYSLIHNDQLLLGPIKYNYKLINFDLEELELEQRLNSQSYTQVPIQFDETTFLLPAREVRPEHDARFHNITPPVWSITKVDGVPTEVVFTYSAVDKSIEQVKQERKALVAPERRNKENTTIIVNVQGTDVEVSTSRENRLSLASKLLSSPGPHNFKFGDDFWLQITTADLETIIQAVDAKVQEAFDWELAKLQEIDACLSAEDVHAVEIVPAPVEEPLEEIV